MRQCKCGGIIKQNELTLQRESWHCESCGKYEIQMKSDLIIEHYANLALKPAWLDYVRQQVKLMEQEPAFHGIGKLIAQRIKELKNEHN
jgi:hypothetical protein